MSEFQPARKRSSRQIQTLLENIRVGGNLETGDLVQVINHYRPTYRRSKIRPEQLPVGARQFVGRRDEVTQIEAAFRQGRGVVISTIAGMGGVGKTELAIQYALAHREQYPGGILWLNALSQDLAAQIITFVDMYVLEMPEEIRAVAQPEFQLQYCLQYWQGRGRVLLILDDVAADCGFRSIVQQLPPDFRVLLTTRVMGLDGGFFELPLEILPMAEALQLLRGLLGETRVNGQLAEAEALCEGVGRLPLAVELVGRYLVGHRLLKLVELREKLSLESEVLARGKDEFMTASRGVIAAFEVSWQGLGEQVHRVGMLLGLFGSEGFGWDLVEKMAESIGIEPEVVERSRDALYQGHWMQRSDGDELFRLHPLIQQFFLGKMREVGQQESLRKSFVKVIMDIAREIPEQPTRQMLPALEQVIPHLKIVTEKFLDAVSDNDLVWSYLGIARFYEGQGLYGLAEPWYEECVETTRSTLGEDHPSYTSSLNKLGFLYYRQGRHGEAEPLFRKALEIERSTLGEDHKSYANNLGCLAILYESQGRYGEAESLYRKTLEIERSTLGEDHPSYASSLHNLADLYQSQGRYGEAEPLLRQALEIYRSTLGEDHPSYASSLHNLASLYQSQGRYGEAEPLFRQTLEIERSTLGEDHPSYASSLHNLASLYQSQGRYGEAEPLLRQALEITRSTLGEDHPSYASSLNNVASLYDSQGRYGEAEPLLRQALEIKRSTLGEDHPSHATSLSNLALLYSQSFNPWKWLKACYLSIQVIRIEWKTLGWKHPTIRISIWTLLMVCLLPAIFIWIISQGFFLSLKTHNLLPITRSIFIVFLIILIQRSNLETRLWAKAKHKLSKRKKSPPTPNSGGAKP